MSHLTPHQQLNRSRQWSATQNYPETGLWEVKEMFPVRLGIVRQLRVPFVCRTSSGSMGASDRTSRLTVGKPLAAAVVTFRKPTSRYLSDEVAGSDLALMLPGNLIRDPGSETAWVALPVSDISSVLGNALGNRGD